MKHWSLWLTVILLGAMPLAAAAFDYGANGPLLAANTSQPQLPGSQLHATEGTLASGDVQADDASAPAVESTPRTRTAPSTASAPRPVHTSRTVTSKPHQPPPLVAPDPLQSQATWQSLLPGSIQ
ncbi:MAG TPA: hypothetical protein VFL63_09335 [Rhodanobacteraceae bacterium]|jgi:hypothetical protein|nr:hypothetical protein [Rhodanobacteraceae bacterium]